MLSTEHVQEFLLLAPMLRHFVKVLEECVLQNQRIVEFKFIRWQRGPESLSGTEVIEL